jgi:hypothetical protein
MGITGAPAGASDIALATAGAAACRTSTLAR